MTASDRDPLLAGIVAHWHDETNLGELVAAWPRDPRFELVVVDNGSSAALADLHGATAAVLHPRRNPGSSCPRNAPATAVHSTPPLGLNPYAALDTLTL